MSTSVNPHTLYPTNVLKVNLACCNACVAKVSKLLINMAGVHEVDVNPEEGIVLVLGKVNPCELIKKIKKLNKNAVLIKVNPPNNTQKINGPNDEGDHSKDGPSGGSSDHHGYGQSHHDHGHDNHHHGHSHDHSHNHPHHHSAPQPPQYQRSPPCGPAPPPSSYYGYRGDSNVQAANSDPTHYSSEENGTGCTIM